MGKVKDKIKDAISVLDSEGRAIVRTKRSKFKCATSGKHNCDDCGKDIDRGETIRFVDVKYADGTEERYKFCCKEHRNNYCDSHGIPQDDFLKALKKIKQK